MVAPGRAQEDSWHPYPDNEQEGQVMEEIGTGRAGGSLVQSTRDLMVIAAIGVAFDVVLVCTAYVL
jgi:hypothetical protein